MHLRQEQTPLPYQITASAPITPLKSPVAEGQNGNEKDTTSDGSASNLPTSDNGEASTTAEGDDSATTKERTKMFKEWCGTIERDDIHHTKLFVPRGLLAQMLIALITEHDHFIVL